MFDDILTADFIQASRVLKVSSPLGDDQLLPERMKVDEGVNRLFEITLHVRAKREAVKPEELIGKLVDISWKSARASWARMACAARSMAW